MDEVTNVDQLMEIHNELVTEAWDLMKTKNADYAGESDPFRNFRRYGTLGVLVRLSDKIARLETFHERGEFSVKDESLRDTVRDIINYAVIFYAMKVSA